MISQYDVRKLFERKWNDDDSIPYRLEGDEVVLLNTGTTIPISNFTIYLRKLNHCDFESIYYDSASLMNILRCNQCGAVIFSMEDEDYDAALRCPNCGGYDTQFEYWTKEDIEADELKQILIRSYEDITEAIIEREKRYERRKKRDDEIFTHTYYGKKRYLYIGLKCNDLFRTSLKGLHIQIDIGSKEDKDDIGYTIHRSIMIPLSWHRFYLRFIYPYTKKCHPDHRKYLPWQKKGENHA